MAFKDTFTIIILLAIITSAITSIFYFLGVDFSIYGNYLVWIWMLVIFFMVLPSDQISKLV